MHRDWLAMEHYRLHVIEQWPYGPEKEARLAAVHATIESLARTAPLDEPPFECATCITAQNKARLLRFPDRHVEIPSTKAA
jgi:hypothetical protein